MDFDEVVVKESPGLCRCCLSEGCYKDLGSEYSWMGDTEIYADMLLECFDIGISQHIEGPNGPNRLICEVCITRLRDACNFKKQVVESEKKFVDMVGRGEFRDKAVVFEGMKTEPPPQAEALDVEYLDDIDFGEEADPEDLLKTDTDAEGTEDITVAALPVKRGRGRPRKHPVVKPEKKSKLAKYEEKARSSKSSAKGERKGVRQLKRPTTRKIPEDIDPDIGQWSRKTLSTKQKRDTTIKNVLHVLLKSNVMPFRWLKSAYRCFYCYDIFQEPADLKLHQVAHDNDEIKVKAMNNYWEPVVYVDTSNLACKLCEENIKDLYDLIDHLVAKHAVVYNKDVGINITAFKLDNTSVTCLVCMASFRTFGHLLMHTNKQHKGASTILCDLCGQHFKGENLLRTHVKSAHENTQLLCTECGDKFESKSKLLTHERHSHDKKFKCLVCPELFKTHYKRSQHMAASHKNRSEVKCMYCPKTFVFRSNMTTHVRDSHLKERNHICSVCGWRSFSSNRLKNHMYKHSGEKNFKCEVCDKAFTTKKIMRAHFGRIHKNKQSYGEAAAYVAC